MKKQTSETTRREPTVATYILLPLDEFTRMQEQLDIITRHIIHEQEDYPAGKEELFLTRKALCAITGYAEASMTRYLKIARKAGIQTIGTGNKLRYHKKQFLEILNRETKNTEKK